MEAVLLFLLGVVIFIVGLVISVALHELGHLTFAKLFGVKVSQYMVGFGRTLWSRTRGGTEYGIKPILLGGYISMAGMFPPGSAGSEEAKPQGVLFSALVQDARASSAGSIGGADHSSAFYMAKPWKRIVIMFAGPFMNLVIGVIIAAVLVTGFGAPTATIADVANCVPTSASTTAASTCEADAPASPASTSGLKKGDLIVSIDGNSYPSSAIVQSTLQRSAGKPVSMIVKRAGKRVTISITPVSVSRDALDSSGISITDTNGKPVVQKLGAIGVGLGNELIPQPVTATFGAVGSEVNGIFGVIGRLPTGVVGVWNAVFNGATRSPSSPVSVVGVGRAIGDVASTQDAPAKLKAYTILSLVGQLNLSLFIFNLIPLLPLDGGHIVGAVWEAVRRFVAKLFRRRDPGPVDLAKLMPLTVAVVGVLIAVSALLIVGDLVNPIPIG
jgi:membrane-associated protease RseP (regulator of RpoE activity)